MTSPACFFRQFDSPPCDGVLQRCHLIPKQRLKRNGVPASEVWDPRLWVWGCERHHRRFDNHWFRLGRVHLPIRVFEWAGEHGWWYDDARHGFYKASDRGRSLLRHASDPRAT